MIELPGDELQSADYWSLQSRWISRELADLAKIRRVYSDTVFDFARQLINSV